MKYNRNEAKAKFSFYLFMLINKNRFYLMLEEKIKFFLLTGTKIFSKIKLLKFKIN